jgi:hypothetical protein
MSRQNTGNHPEPPQPNVWIVYNDKRKDMSTAERFGQLKEMFTGRVNYPRAVEHARKMLQGYQAGDHILIVGDPALCGIVMTVALEYAPVDSQVLSILRWDRDELEYQQMTVDFNDEPVATAAA